MKNNAGGVRAQKKALTRKRIEKAALELAVDRGINETTIDEICKRANVSRMTFFNYFPSKASVFTGRSGKMPSVDEMVALIEQEAEGSYLDAILAMGMELFPARRDDEITRLRRQVLNESPEISMQEREHEIEARRTAWLTIKRFLERNPDKRLAPERPVEEEAGIAANMVSSLYRIAFALAIRCDEAPRPADVRHLAAAFLSADRPKSVPEEGSERETGPQR